MATPAKHMPVGMPVAKGGAGPLSPIKVIVNFFDRRKAAPNQLQLNIEKFLESNIERSLWKETRNILEDGEDLLEGDEQHQPAGAIIHKRRHLKFSQTLEAIAKMHGGSPSHRQAASKIFNTLMLVADLQRALNAAMELYEFFVPKLLIVQLRCQSSGKTVRRELQLKRLDDECRGIYGRRRSAEDLVLDCYGIKLEWSEHKWIYTDDEYNLRAELDSPLVTDPGAWATIADDVDYRLKTVARIDTHPVSKDKVEELRELFQPDHSTAHDTVSAEKIAARLGDMVSGLMTSSMTMAMGESVDALCKVGGRLGWTDFRMERTPNDPRELIAILAKLLEQCAQRNVFEELRNNLPSYDCIQGADKKKEPLEQVRALNCRLLDFCDLRNPAESSLPRVLHQLSLLSWQQQNHRQITYVDTDRLDDKEGRKGDGIIIRENIIVDEGGNVSPDVEGADDFPGRIAARISEGTRGWIEQERGNDEFNVEIQSKLYKLFPGNYFRRAGHCRRKSDAWTEDNCRFVVLSDTHGWHAELQIPEGDILLYNGNALFDASHSGEDSGTTAALSNFFDFVRSKLWRFKWIFMVCGNHDQPIYDLWTQAEDKLVAMLPDNVVLLQAYWGHLGENGNDFTLPSNVLTKNAEVAEQLKGCNGSVWIKPKRVVQLSKHVKAIPDNGFETRKWTTEHTNGHHSHPKVEVVEIEEIDVVENGRVTKMIKKFFCGRILDGTSHGRDVCGPQRGQCEECSKLLNALSKAYEKPEVRHKKEGEWISLDGFILHAEYGHGKSCRDVTERLKELARTQQWIRVANQLFGEDPAEGKTKELTVKFVEAQTQLQFDLLPAASKDDGLGDEHQSGWVLSGTGISLPAHAWSTKKACQLMRIKKPKNGPQRQQEEENKQQRKAAAEALLKHKPFIVMTHGPPEADQSCHPWDDDGGDPELRAALEKDQDTKIVIFGHRRQNFGCNLLENGRAFINAAVATPLCVPARAPFVFDLKVGEPDLEIDTDFRLRTAHMGGLRCWEVVVHRLMDLLTFFMHSLELAGNLLSRCLHIPCHCLHSSETTVRAKQSITLRKLQRWYEEDVFDLPDNRPAPRLDQALKPNPFRPMLTDAKSFEKQSSTKSDLHEALLSKEQVQESCAEKDTSCLASLAEMVLPHEAHRKRVPGCAWLPKVWVNQGCLDLWREKQEKAATEAVGKIQAAAEAVGKIQPPDEEINKVRKEARDTANLADFDVAGPAVLYAFQSAYSWAFAPVVTVIAYKTAIMEDGDVFAHCSIFMAVVFALNFWYLWAVQAKVLSFVVLSQVLQLGERFKVIGTKPSFHNWKRFMWVFTAINLLDLTNQCIFFGVFLRSSDNNHEINDVWNATISQSSLVNYWPFDDMASLFTVCWLCTFLQVIYLMLHCVTFEDEGVSYKYASMPNGYPTAMSHIVHCTTGAELLHKDAKTDGVNWNFWHADILRILAIYGRMPALIWHDRALMKKRLAKEWNPARYLQILVQRLKEFCFRLILIDVLEKAFKLEMQISIFCIDLALLTEEDKVNKWQTCNWQMLFSIVISFASFAYAVMNHALVFHECFYLHERAPEVTSAANKHERSNVKVNHKSARILLLVYALSTFILLLFFMHCIFKAGAAFWCPDSMSNIGGCAVLDRRPSSN